MGTVVNMSWGRGYRGTHQVNTVVLDDRRAKSGQMKYGR